MPSLYLSILCVNASYPHTAFIDSHPSVINKTRLKNKCGGFTEYISIMPYYYEFIVLCIHSIKPLSAFPSFQPPSIDRTRLKKKGGGMQPHFHSTYTKTFSAGRLFFFFIYAINQKRSKLDIFEACLISAFIDVCAA